MSARGRKIQATPERVRRALDLRTAELADLERRLVAAREDVAILERTLAKLLDPECRCLVDGIGTDATRAACPTHGSRP